MPGEHIGIEQVPLRCRTDARSVAARRPDKALSRQDLDGLAERRPADAGPRRKRLLRRQDGPWWILPAHDGEANFVHGAAGDAFGKGGANAGSHQTSKLMSALYAGDPAA